MVRGITYVCYVVVDDKRSFSAVRTTYVEYLSSGQRVIQKPPRCKPKVHPLFIQGLRKGVDVTVMDLLLAIEIKLDPLGLCVASFYQRLCRLLAGLY